MIVMEIRELEAFLAVMSTGSITAAARLLDRSQSQVTRLIQDLEISVGFALLDRNGPKIAPSEKGIAFHAEAERFLSGIGHLRERARTIAEKEPQPIEIVAIPAFASGIIPLALAALPEKLLPRKSICAACRQRRRCNRYWPARQISASRLCRPTSRDWKCTGCFRDLALPPWRKMILLPPAK